MDDPQSPLAREVVFARFLPHLFNQSSPTTANALLAFFDLRLRLMKNRHDVELVYAAYLLAALADLYKYTIKCPSPHSFLCLFLAAAMVANKMVDDDPYSTDSWVHISVNLCTPEELKAAQRDLCQLLHWRLNVPHPALIDFELSIRARYFWPGPYFGPPLHPFVSLPGLFDDDPNICPLPLPPWLSASAVWPMPQTATPIEHPLSPSPSTDRSDILNAATLLPRPSSNPPVHLSPLRSHSRRRLLRCSSMREVPVEDMDEGYCSEFSTSDSPILLRKSSIISTSTDDFSRSFLG
ncbi:uncharacterized protein BXZ73DRAFT_74494 [Epithele typhae]|uniref:uncharacterized protein n=1 Tax=Epithele typhae TaxID=378194 RepID=UPI002007D6A3|nr:uncharacterized protein BXZ73DRAFT_74494 [Epithele typhae]KAH9942192.1 hypothetical protein BXZ73DRAFT_74494 [Epithele typhae]